MKNAGFLLFAVLVFIWPIFDCIKAEECTNWRDGYTVGTVPNPKQSGKDNYVSNPDFILSENTIANINKLCGNLEEVTGAQLAVVVVNDFIPKEDGAYNFALKLFDIWGIGDVKADNGMLFFVATNSGDIWIITGSKIERIVTDEICASFIDNNIPYFNQRSYNDGVTHIVSDITRFCTQDDVKKKLKALYLFKFSSWWLIFIVITFGILIGILIVGRRK